LEKYGITDNRMQMDLDDVGPAYFCGMKNYVVEHNGKLTIHGSSLKSSRKCYIEDRARDLAIQHWFNNKPVDEVIREAYDYSNVTLDDFKYRIRLSKDLEGYDDKSGQVAFLSEQYKQIKGKYPTQDTQLGYIISNKSLSDPIYKKFYNKKSKGENYKFIELAKSTNEVDHKYYDKQIDKALAKFNIYKIKQEDFLSTIGVSDIPADVTLDKVPYNF